MNSIDDGGSGDEGEVQSDGWRVDLGDRIEQILDRKRSSVAGREESLAAFNRLASSKYVQEEVHNSRDALVAAFLKSIKSENSETEAVLALKGEQCDVTVRTS